MNEKMEEKMNSQKKITIILTFLTVTLLTLNLSYAQTNVGPTMTFPGVIEKISGNFKFVVVNEAKILLSSGTQIMDDRGNTLTVSDLKPRSPITIEVLKSPRGFLAKKIVLKTQGR
jgi:hypothetical protein